MGYKLRKGCTMIESRATVGYVIVCDECYKDIETFDDVLDLLVYRNGFDWRADNVDGVRVDICHKCAGEDEEW
jgi:hypothetical protein